MNTLVLWTSMGGRGPQDFAPVTGLGFGALPVRAGLTGPPFPFANGCEPRPDGQGPEVINFVVL